jgi:hypothetical protein
LVGVVALTIFFVVPVVVAFSARRRSSDPELRLLCAALAGAALAGTACSFTFDSLSFPMFANVEALVVGLIGAAWRLAVTARSSTTTPPDAGSAFAAPAAGTRALLSTGGSSWIC